MSVHTLFDHVNTLYLQMGSPPSRHASIAAQPALSPDIDRMGAVLEIVRDAHKIDRLFAHSIRLEQMTFSSLGRRDYTLYLQVFEIIRRETPLRLIRQTDRVYVPIYRVYLADYGDNSGWTVSAVTSQGEVIPESVHSRRSSAVDKALFRLRGLVEHKVSLRRSHESLLQTPVSVFDKPPISKDADATMVEALWRTLKRRFTNEVLLSELSA
jgi:hypothetical protein